MNIAYIITTSRQSKIDSEHQIVSLLLSVKLRPAKEVDFYLPYR